MMMEVDQLAFLDLLLKMKTSQLTTHVQDY